MFFAKLVLRGTVLGLAGFGAQQLWTRYRRPAERVLREAADAVDMQIAPTVRDAARATSHSSKMAAERVIDTSKAAATDVVHSARGAVAAAPDGD